MPVCSVNVFLRELHMRTTVSIKVMTMVWDAEFPNVSSKMVALKLADCANDDGDNIYPSVGTVERATGGAASTVRKYMFAMEHCGLLEVVERGVGGARTGTTVRRFNLDILRSLHKPRYGGRAEASLVEVETEHSTVVKGVCKTVRVVVFEIKTPPPGGALSQADPSASRRHPSDRQGATPPPDGAKPSLEPSEIRHDSPPTPLKGVGVRRDLALVLDQVRAKPSRQRVMDRLLEPVVRQRAFNAPDRVYALGILADYCEELAEHILDAARVELLARRHSSVRQADIMHVIQAQIEAQEVELKRVAEDAENAKRRPNDPVVEARFVALQNCLCEHFGNALYEAWFSRMEWVGFADDILTLSFSSKFITGYVKSHHEEALRACVKKTFGRFGGMDLVARSQPERAA